MNDLDISILWFIIFIIFIICGLIVEYRWKKILKFLSFFGELMLIGAVVSMVLTYVIVYLYDNNVTLEKWERLLVDNNYPVEERIIKSISPHELENGELVDERLYEPLMQMIEDARAQKVDLYVISGIRTNEQQAEIYENRVNRYVQYDMSQKQAEEKANWELGKPGCNEHEAGLAVDLGDGVLHHKLSNEACQWLKENSWKYGFIQRFTEWNEGVTKRIAEPAHYRFVGVDVAKEMHDNQILSLEEYLDPSLSTLEERIERMIEVAIIIAEDDTHGYEQSLEHRNGPDYDCASFVYKCLQAAGIPIEWMPHYTGNQIKSLEESGFEYVDVVRNIRRGDILFSDKDPTDIKDDHTSIYLGEGKIVEAHENENSAKVEGLSGDQTGHEIHVIEHGEEYIEAKYTGFFRYTGN